LPVFAPARRRLEDAAVKYLLWMVVLVAAVSFWRRARRVLNGPTDAPGAARPDAAAPAKNATENMLACAHCGVFLPESEALRDAGGAPYCSPAHLARGPRAVPRR
jgi:uncharacterized protein